MDKTIVVFTSDHGEEFLEHGRCFHLTTLYREVLHVPLIVAGPGVAHRRVAGLVPASVTIAPTVLDLVGIHDTLPGPSLTGAVAGEPPRFDAVISETYRSERGGRGRGQVLAVTRADDKLIHWVTEGRYEYFDLLADPDELRPLDQERPSVRRLKELLAAWVAAHPIRAVQEDLSTPESRDLEKELKALGYIE
jgi:arylsulfatase A-like enzyme